MLDRVTGVDGRVLRFNYTNARVTSVVDAAGATWTYGYNASGMLSSVTSPGPNASTRTYHYEDPTSIYRLTGISVDGVRWTRYGYDTAGRVASSGTDNGEEHDTFVYGVNETTLTDARGQPTTYTFAPVQGAP